MLWEEGGCEEKSPYPDSEESGAAGNAARDEIVSHNFSQPHTRPTLFPVCS